MNYSSNPQPNSSPFENSTHNVVPAQATQTARMEFLRLTYSHFLAGIVMCILGGFLCLTTPLASLVVGMSPLSFLALIPISIGAQMLAHSRSAVAGYVGLFGYTFFLGVIIAPVLAIYNPAILAEAAFMSAVMFGALTAYVFITKKDFSFMGGFLFVGMISLVLAGLANAFIFKGAGIDLWISWGVLLMSSGFVLYKTSNIMRTYPTYAYCGAALGLFISFFNMFLSLLRILGGSRR